MCLPYKRCEIFSHISLVVIFLDLLRIRYGAQPIKCNHFVAATRYKIVAMVVSEQPVSFHFRHKINGLIYVLIVLVSAS